MSELTFAATSLDPSADLVTNELGEALPRETEALERLKSIGGAYGQLLARYDPAREPSNLMTGRPLIYRKTGTDQFTLYSVGLNGLDDGGRVVAPPASQDRWARTITSRDLIDWVWRYPARGRKE